MQAVVQGILVDKIVVKEAAVAKRPSAALGQTVFVADFVDILDLEIVVVVVLLLVVVAVIGCLQQTGKHAFVDDAGHLSPNRLNLTR